GRPAGCGGAKMWPMSSISVLGVAVYGCFTLGRQDWRCPASTGLTEPLTAGGDRPRSSQPAYHTRPPAPGATNQIAGTEAILRLGDAVAGVRQAGNTGEVRGRT